MNRSFMLTTAVLTSIGAATAAAQGPQSTTATYADWTVRCVTQNAVKACEMTQITQIKGRPQPVSQIAIGHQTKGGPLKVVFGVPVDVWLPDGIELVTGQKQTDVTAKFTRCVPAACFAEADLSGAEVKQMRYLKKNGKLQFRNSRKQQIAVPVSFNGFGDAYDALQK